MWVARQLKTEWPKTLYAPQQSDKNWSIILPFANTYKNAFESMCQINSHAHHGKGDRLIMQTWRQPPKTPD